MRCPNSLLTFLTVCTLIIAGLRNQAHAFPDSVVSLPALDCTMLEAKPLSQAIACLDDDEFEVRSAAEKRVEELLEVSIRSAGNPEDFAGSLIIHDFFSALAPTITTNVNLEIFRRIQRILLQSRFSPVFQTWINAEFSNGVKTAAHVAASAHSYNRAAEALLTDGRKLVERLGDKYGRVDVPKSLDADLIACGFLPAKLNDGVGTVVHRASGLKYELSHYNFQPFPGAETDFPSFTKFQLEIDIPAKVSASELYSPALRTLLIYLEIMRWGTFDARLPYTLRFQDSEYAESGYKSDFTRIETSYPGAPILQLRAILYVAETSEFTSVFLSDEVNSDTEVAGPLPVPIRAELYSLEAVYQKFSDSLLSKKSEDL